MIKYRVSLESKISLVRRTTTFESDITPEKMTNQRIVGILGPHEVEGERIVGWWIIE